jgi:MFS family permease
MPDPIAAQDAQSEESLPEILRMPTRPLSRTFRLLFALASIVTGLCNVTIKQLLLPAQVGFLDPSNRFTTFAVIASVGALAGVIAAPLAGALSDRTVSRWGRRRPWIVLGIVVTVIGLVVMAQATSIIQLLVGEILVQIAVDTIMSAVTAIVPDQVPLKQRGAVSAFIGMSPIVGGLVGLLLVARFTNATLHPQQGYYVLAVASTVIVLLFLFVLRDPALSRDAVPAFNFRSFAAGFWLNPRKYPNFAFVWFSRCLIFLGYTILISYIFFYLQDVIHYQGPDKGVTIFQVIATGVLIIAAIVSGVYADRLQQLKPFVFGGAIVMMVSLLLIAFIPKWPIMLVAAVILGIGFGVYLAVDLALAVRVLPVAANRGKDLGIINTAIFLPLILSPIIGSTTLNLFHSYAALFTLAAVCFLLAAVLILPIKAVR